jgi:hypothetical protein
MSGSTFLSLTNRVLRHFNEVQLTSSNFSTATGFQSTAQDYVNESIREIQQSEYEWPFNYHTTSQVCTVGSAPTISGLSQYSLPVDCESVDWDTFQLVEDLTLTNPVTQKWLPSKDYDYFIQNDMANDADQAARINAGTGSFGVQPPRYIYRTQDLKFGITPIPDQAYTIKYEWWGFPSELSAYGDTTTVPSRFDHVIAKGAIARAYAFRGNVPMTNIYNKWKDEGISKMRELLINRYKTVRDGRVGRYG